MTRSRRRTPVRGITLSDSEKADKVASHRRIRRAVRQVVAVGPEALLPFEKQLTNPYSMAKDGKRRFDPVKTPKLMRK
jgi:hypothetical protein